MKKIITLIILLILTFSVLSQEYTSEYPKIIDDSTGLYVVMTIDQARVIDSKLDILDMFEYYSVILDSYDSACIEVVNERDSIIYEQDIQISNLFELNNNKDNIIKNLQDQLSVYKIKQMELNAMILDDRKLIDLHLDRIKKLEKTILWGGVGSGAVIITTIILLIAK